MLRAFALAVGLFLSALAGVLTAQTAPPSLDEAALAAAGIEGSPAAVKAELDRLASVPADGAFARRLLLAARWAAATKATACDKALLRCALRVRNPLVQWALAEAIGRGGVRVSLPDPSALANSGNPSAMAIARALLARTPGKPSADLLATWAASQGGWAAFGATEGLRALGDARYLAQAKSGLRSEDAMLRWAYHRLLGPDHRVAGYEVMDTPGRRAAALSAGKTASPSPAGPETFMLVGAEPDFIQDIAPDGAAAPAQHLALSPILARRIGPDALLLVTPLGFRVQNNAGRIAYTSKAGSGPQNDVRPVGDGTWLVADGGSFLPSLAERTCGLYIWSPVTGKVTWRLKTANPLTVQPAPVGTLLVARGEGGLAWIDGKTGNDVVAVKGKAPCRAAALLPSADAIAAVGAALVRVNPAGAVTWRVALPGQVTSVAAVSEVRYFATVAGQGLYVVDAREPQAPKIKLLVAVPKGVCRVAGPS